MDLGYATGEINEDTGKIDQFKLEVDKFKNLATSNNPIDVIIGLLTDRMANANSTIEFTEKELRATEATNAGKYKDALILRGANFSNIRANILDILATSKNGEEFGLNYEDIKADQEAMNSAYSTFFSDLFKKGAENLHFEDYQLDISESEWTNMLSTSYDQIVATYGQRASMLIEEQNALMVQALEKETQSTIGAEDVLKNVNFLKSDLAYASIDTLQSLADSLHVAVETLFNPADYDAALGGYKVDMAALAANGLNEIINSSNIVADSVKAFLDSISEDIGKGLEGKLGFAERDNLISNLGKYGMELDAADFTRTADGLKLSEQKAIELYNTLKQIDGISAQITFDALAKSLEDNNENYTNISTIAKRIADLQREIDNPDISSARRQEYEAELAVAEEIYRVRSSTDNKSFDFMNRDLPNGMQNPIDYWNSTGEAYKAMNQAAKSGYMEIQDFYNIVNEMNNMAAVSGNTLFFMGQTLSGKAEDAAALIEAGMSALKNVDGEGVKIALGSLGTDFATGAADMAGDFDTGIKEMAKSQIKMLDAAIRMLEAIVAMENIDINGDGAFDLGEIFANGADSSGGFTQPVMDWLRQIDIATGGIQVGAQSLQQALLELGKVNPDSVVAIMNQLKNIDWTLGDVNTFAQIQNVLSTFFPGVQISQLGPSVFDLLDIPSNANEKATQFQDFMKKTGLGVKEAKGVIQAIENGILKPMSGKYGEHLGAKKGENVYSAIENMLGLDKKGKKTFESFAGDYLTEDELQMWSKINIDYKKNGKIGSAIYTASDGSTHVLDPKNVTGWQSEIEKIEDTIFKQQQTGRQDVANVEDSEPVTLESGFTVKGLIEAKDGGVDAWYNGTYLGNFPDKAAANAAIEAEALKRDKEARGIGNKTVITPEGTIETRADFTRKAKLSAEETQENKDFEKAVGQVYKEDADKINSLFQKGGQWENYLKTGENGERTLELPGFESIKLSDDQNPADLIKQLGEDLFGTPDQFAEIPAKIAEGITQAFQGDAGSKIGEAIRTGIENAFKGAKKETGTEQQAIPIDEVTLAPEKVVLDLQGKAPTLKENPELNNAIPLGEINGTVTTVMLTTVGGVTKTEATIITNNDVGDIGDVTGTASNGEITSIEGEWSFVQTDAAGNITLSESLGTVKATADGATVTVADNNFLPETTDIITTLTYTSATGEVTTITVTPTSGYETDNTNGVLTYTGTNEVDIDNVNVKPTNYTITWTDAAGNVKSVDVPANVLLQSNNYTEFVSQIQDLVKPETKIIDFKYNLPDDDGLPTPEEILADPKYNWRPSYMNDNATVAQAPQIKVTTAEAEEATTEQVLADNATITANGATVIVSTKTSGDNGGGHDNTNSDKSGTLATTTTTTTVETNVDSSQFTAEMNVIQNAMDSISGDTFSEAATGAETAATKISAAFSATMEGIPNKKTVDIDIDDTTANVSVKASVDVDVKVNVSGAEKTGETLAPAKGVGAPNTPKTIKVPVRSRSKSKGNVALAKGRETLMGELGPELVVSGGRYYTVGNNGAEFVDLPDDAIVFNHKQTRRLLGNKKATTGGSRGTPVKSENAALSFATGNITGPAFASASAALAALKQIRAMWQSMLDASAKDLGGLAGSGGGGGGGGGGGEDKDKLIPSYATTEIQRWYTWLRKIYRLEQEITYQDTLQNKLQNDQIANGRQIYASYQKNLKNLREEISLQQKTVELQQKWLDAQGAKIEDRSDPLWRIFQYDKDQKLLTYRGNDAPQSGFGLDILEQLNRRNAQGIQVGNAASAAAQIKYLKSVGYDINSLLYNDDGSKIANVKIKNGKEVYYDPKTGKKMKAQEKNDAQVAMVENFFEKVQAKMDEIDSLQESIDDTNNSILENENKINEILNSIRDNQIDLENKVLDAIVAREQKRIDDLQDQRDALEDANSKFLDGLNESLSKEREMYQRNESQTELTKLQRQLSILQRSGGSASQIASLQKQITDKQRDMYFDERQAQIDALQEASDKQIERLDTQIDIMTEALEYQEKNGLLWGEVYEIMSRNETDIAGFISTWSDEFKEKGPTEINKMMTELLESAQIFTADRDKQTNWNNFKDTMSKNSKYANIMKDSNIQTAAQKAYEDEYISTGGNKASSEKAAMAYLDSKLPKTTTTTNNNSSNNQPDESKAIATAPLAVAKVPYYSSADGKKKGNLNNKKGQVVQILQNKVGKKKNREKIYYNNKEYYVALSSFSKKNWKSTSVKKSEQEKKAKELGLKGAIKFKQGGLVDFTGPAWVDGTKRKPEAFLNASQTQFLKDSLTSSVRTSLPDAITGLNGILQDIAQAMNYKNGALDNAVIEHAEVNINVPAINNGMDACQVGELAFDELMKIARKSGTRALQRR